MFFSIADNTFFIENINFLYTVLLSILIIQIVYLYNTVLVKMLHTLKLKKFHIFGKWSNVHAYAIYRTDASWKKLGGI